MACINKLIQILRCLHRTGWIKTRPAQKLLVRVKFTGNSYSYSTCVNVNSHDWNTCKPCLLEAVRGYPDLYSYQCECSLSVCCTCHAFSSVGSWVCCSKWCCEFWLRTSERCCQCSPVSLLAAANGSSLSLTFPLAVVISPVIRFSNIC